MAAYEEEVAALKTLLEEELAAAAAEREAAVAAVRRDADNNATNLTKQLRHVQTQHRCVGIVEHFA